MEALHIKATNDTPEILFDPMQGIFEISGKSLPEDAQSYYQPILEWIEQYFENPNKQTIFNFKIDYINTSSSKIFLSFLAIINDAQKSGHNVKINWYYLDDDEDMYDVGEEYAEIINVPFELISYSLDD